METPVFYSAISSKVKKILIDHNPVEIPIAHQFDRSLRDTHTPNALRTITVSNSCKIYVLRLVTKIRFIGYISPSFEHIKLIPYIYSVNPIHHGYSLTPTLSRF